MLAAETISQCEKSKKNIFNNIENEINLNDIFNLIDVIQCSMSTKKILKSTYQELQFLYKHSSLMLDKISLDDGLLDLTMFEGRGFYQKEEGLMLYHKGAGSIEALAIQEKYKLPDIYYPAFGAEYPGKLGLFSYTSILGVKLLWQCIWEFVITFTMLVSYIETKKIKSVKEIIGKISIPLSVSRLHDLTSVILDHLHDKPISIQMTYHDMSNVLMAAKMMMLVPNHIRGTDNHKVDLKWSETENIFFRSMSLFNTKLHKYPSAPFIDGFHNIMRAKSIRMLLDADLLYRVDSSHLQNFYFFDQNWVDHGFNACDLGDTINIRDLSQNERSFLIANSLCGWRSAESIGPSYFSDKTDITYKEIINQAEDFYGSLLSESTLPKDFGLLYLIVPYSLVTTLSQYLAAIADKNPQQMIGKQIIEILSPDLSVIKQHEKVIEKHKLEILELYGQLITNRPTTLISLMKVYLENAKSEIIELIVKISSFIYELNVNNITKKKNYYILGNIIELLIHSNEFDQYYAERLIETIGNYNQLKLFARESLRKKILSFSKGMDRYSFMKDYLEEIIHVKSHAIRNWFYNAIEYNDLDNWLRNLRIIANEILEDSENFLQKYFGYIFKRKDIYKPDTNNDAISILQKAYMSWDGTALPIERVYAKVRLKDIQSECLISSFLDLVDLFYDVE